MLREGWGRQGRGGASAACGRGSGLGSAWTWEVLAQDRGGKRFKPKQLICCDFLYFPFSGSFGNHLPQVISSSLVSPWNVASFAAFSPFLMGLWFSSHLGPGIRNATWFTRVIRGRQSGDGRAACSLQLLGDWCPRRRVLSLKLNSADVAGALHSVVN